MLLKENGYRILTATNGTDAVDAFMSHSVDLVVLDYHMPGMNGEAAPARMKDSNPEVPSVLVSGDEDVKLSDLEAVDCLMTKSEAVTTFLEKVDYLLSLRFLYRPFGSLETEGGRVATNGSGVSWARLHRHHFAK